MACILNNTVNLSTDSNLCINLLLRFSVLTSCFGRRKTVRSDTIQLLVCTLKI